MPMFRRHALVTLVSVLATMFGPALVMRSLRGDPCTHMEKEMIVCPYPFPQCKQESPCTGDAATGNASSGYFGCKPSFEDTNCQTSLVPGNVATCYVLYPCVETPENTCAPDRSVMGNGMYTQAKENAACPKKKADDPGGTGD
jgi:hypothetical protein